jgi:DNA repair protein RadD
MSRLQTFTRRAHGAEVTALRPYQVDLYQRTRRAAVELRKISPDKPAAVLLVLPTGGGKTAIAGELIKTTTTNGGRTLVLAHRRELIDQMWLRLHKIEVTAGLIMAGRTARPDLPVQVASKDTIVARDCAPDGIDLIVVDEAHHAAADDYRAILGAYPKAKAILGLTATPERSDGATMSPPFDRLVVACQISDLMKDGWLLECDIVRPPGPKPLKYLSAHPVDAYIEHAAGERCVVFTMGIKEADQWAEEAQARGIEARAAHSKKSAKEREATLKAFAAGEVRLVFNPMILTEGWDCPACSVAIIARGCDSLSLWIQMIGRVLRPSEGRTKPGERAKVIDLRGLSWAHGLPDEDHEFSLHGKAMKRKSDSWRCAPPCGALNAKSSKKCELCGLEKPALQGMKPQEIKAAKLQAATKAGQREAWRLKMRSWCAMLGRIGYEQACVQFSIEWGHKVPRTFPKELKRAA